MAQKRSIFEEVAVKPSAAPVPAGALIARDTSRARRGLRLWLALIFALVVAMITVGGLTRLTDSGLSITEWRPLSGAIPPLSEADWQAEFAAYQAIPEYQLQNKGMTLEAFKRIYWWEWGHRQLGRVIGAVWALGFLGFLAARAIPPGWTGRLFGIGPLVGLQGAVGWWMVTSGFKGTMLDVDSTRLAVHLGLAFAILGLIAWYILLLGRSDAELLKARRMQEPKLFLRASGLMHLAFFQILLGALVAGIDAGSAFPTWPDMNGQFFPADAFYVPDGQGGSLPAWHAFFENPGLVQFVHRIWAYLLLAYGIFAWVHGRRSAHAATRRAFHLVLGMLVLQLGLGIATALTLASPHVAIQHQFGAVLLWVLILRARYLSRFPQAGSIREGTA